VESIAWSFGDFTLLADRRLLMAGGLPVRLGGRALDVLIALVEYAGQFVSREELIARIWGARVVEEINLRVQVATLRRALGDDGRGAPQFIVNVPAKGYCFVAPVARTARAPASSLERRGHAGVSLNAVPLVGRESAVAQLGDALGCSRVVTIVGPGGVGKSAVAFEVAAARMHRHADGVFHVDLSGLADVNVASARIAETLGASIGDPCSAEWVAGSLLDRHVLLLLDGCEGVIDFVALLAEEVLSKAPNAYLLTTSRESLRIPGEQVHRLAPLAVPPAETFDSPESVRSFASVQLFAERARAASGTFEPSTDEMRLMAKLCHRLDGLPLAIELAAHRVEHLGMAAILEQLDDGYDVLVDERRVDVSHQQSLRASFDWSFANLLPQEQQILCRLSVFAGSFSLASGTRLASADGGSVDDTARELIGQLATKSLVSVESARHGVHYRLLGETRAYAGARLHAQGDGPATCLKHAWLVVDLLEAADADQAIERSQAGAERYPFCLDEVRAALDWLSPRRGDDALRMRLLAASVQQWFQYSAIAEYCQRAEDALRRVCGPIEESDRVRVEAALGHARLHVHGPDADSLAASAQALALAGRVDDEEGRLMALTGLWLHHDLSGSHADALALAEAHEMLAASAANGTAIDLVGERNGAFNMPVGIGSGIAIDVMLLVSLMHVGRHAEARARGERTLTSSLLMPRNGVSAGPRLDQQAFAKTNLARLLWIQGLPERSLAMARAAVEVARRSMDDVMSCLCLHGLCVVALWAGEQGAATDAAHRLSELAARHQLGYWAAWARFDRSAVALEDGSPMRADWREPVCGVSQLELMATLATDLPEPEVLRRAETGQAPWCEPEVLRARGCQLARLETEHGRQRALALFDRALSLARAQGALSWELRAATSIATVSDQSREAPMAIELLNSTLGRFTEGFSTPDLRHAHELLERLRSQ
jgi:predicted ATPase/DNA-binding winged helix-turn-helix (wHTH) protein